MQAESASKNLLSYEKFRDFFGYPKSDTCNTSNKHKLDQRKHQADLFEYIIDQNKLKGAKENLCRLELNINLHKLKTESFYDLKQ